MLKSIHQFDLSECNQEIKAIKEKWRYQDSIGYMRDTCDGRKYHAVLDQIKRIEWAKDPENFPDENTLWFWAKDHCDERGYVMPHCPDPRYPSLKILDTKQMRKDYWDYYRETPNLNTHP